MADAFHQAPMPHQLRKNMTEFVARFPFSPLTKGWNRVLFIRPDHLGDMLLATPAMRALKNARPYTEIHVLAGTWSADILANIPEIDQVLTIDFPGFKRTQQKKNYLQPYFQLIKTARQLRQIGYGHAIIMRPDHWWGAMLTHIAGIPERIGYAVDNVTPFLTQAIPHTYEHAVHQNLRLVENWTGTVASSEIVYTLDVFEQEIQQVNDILQQYGIQADSPIFCIHPGAGTWVKRWQNEYWSHVADTLTDQLDAHVIFTGSDTERALISNIQNRMQHKSNSTAGDLNIQQLAALYKRSQVVLGPDSGPLHLAAAVGTPTVALFGPADPIEFAPWGAKDQHIVLTAPVGCRPCRVLDWGDDPAENHPCVRDIAIGQVLEAARRVVNAANQG
jgi:heptosyltransferase-2/heptosyltransferase-3